MLNAILQTRKDYAILLVRLTLGVVFFAHGAQKMLGLFGGYGFSGTMQYFTETMGLPYLVALMVIFAEFFGAIGLIVGCLTRIAALGIIGVMVGAVTMVHLPNGFFMNWFGNQSGEGYEYHLLAIAMALALLIRGAGSCSIDRFLSSKITGDKD